MSSSSTGSKLESLVGLDGAKHVVAELARSQVATHAVLFYGPEGCGKESLADILCEAWLCTGGGAGPSSSNPGSADDGSPHGFPGSSGGADGTCQACKAFARDRNPDLLSIRPQGAGNLIVIKQLIPRPAEGGEQMLSMEEFFRTPPLISKHKVVLISDADRMTPATANTLLKTLEEPPRFGKIVLTTRSVGALTATVLSRVLAVACALPTRPELLAKFPQAEIDDLLVAEQAPAKLEKLLQHPEPFRKTVRFARSLPERSPYEALAVAEEFRSLAEEFDSQLRTGARAAVAESIRILGVICSKDPSAPKGWAGPIVEAHARVLANVNPTLVTDSLFARLLTQDGPTGRRYG